MIRRYLHRRFFTRRMVSDLMTIAFDAGMHAGYLARTTSKLDIDAAFAARKAAREAERDRVLH